jgi:mRNA-degrading endonuclease RelE of RelBE toxin-antitoxin system
LIRSRNATSTSSPSISANIAKTSPSKQVERLDRIIAINLGESPLTWSYFAFTGAPYRAYLFRVGRRTQYWIIYTVDEESRTVDILHFWNAMRDPESLEL